MTADPKEAAKQIKKRYFDQQCFLAENMRDFVSHSKEKNKYGFATDVVDLLTVQESSMLTAIDSQDDAGAIMTSMMSPEGLGAFMGGKPEFFASLVPMVEFYKVIPGDATIQDDKGNTQTTYKEIPLPISFPTYFGENFLTTAGKVDPLLSNRAMRGDDVGVQSFSFSFQNQRPGLAERILTCELKLIFTNASLMFEEMPGGFRYIDLILASRGGRLKQDPIDKNKEEYIPQKYKIRARIGYHEPTMAGRTLFDSDYSDFLRAAKDQVLVLDFLLRDYDLDFQDNGALTMSLTYASYTESSLNSPYFNIFGALSERVQNLNIAWQAQKKKIEASRKRARRLKQKAEAAISADSFMHDEVFANTLYFHEAEGQASVGSIDKQLLKSLEASKLADDKVKGANATLASKKAAYNKKLREVKTMNYRLALERLTKNKKIWQIDVDRSTIDKWQVAKENALRSVIEGKSLSTALKEIKKPPVKSLKSLIKRLDPTKKTRPAGNKKFKLQFFYFGDLINEVLNINKEMTENLKKNRTKIILGNIEAKYVIYGTAAGGTNIQNEQISIGDIPISLKLFKEFWHQVVVKQEKEFYSLGQFLSDCLNQLVGPASGVRCQAEFTARRQNFQTMLITSKRDVKSGRIKRDPVSKKAPWDNLFDHGELTAEDPLNTYMVIYGQGEKPSRSGDEREDMEKSKIYHLYMAADRGLLKTIKFKKAKVAKQQQIKLLRSESGVGSVDEVLWHPYNIEVTMHGNNLFKPGMLMYINPSLAGFGSPVDDGAPARTLGLGGYYLVGKASNEIGPEGWETTVEARFQAVPSIDPKIESEKLTKQKQEALDLLEGIPESTEKNSKEAPNAPSPASMQSSAHPGPA